MDERGMFLEVDLKYPKKLHRLHEDFPLAPERYKITYSELSPINKFLYNKMQENSSQDPYCEEKDTYCEEKLIPTFHNRKCYILHIKCLLFYISHGLILKKKS